MFIVGLLSWWYGAGWKRYALTVRERLASTMDFFSIGLLFETLFSPFRQISAGRVNGSLAVKWQAFVDRLFSRCIGAVIRLCLIVAGLLWIAVVALISGVSLLLWAFVPLLPIVGLVLAMIGWTPTWI